jgi:hypothetical protein
MLLILIPSSKHKVRQQKSKSTIIKPYKQKGQL